MSEHILVGRLVRRKNLQKELNICALSFVHPNPGISFKELRTFVQMDVNLVSFVHPHLRI